MKKFILFLVLIAMSATAEAGYRFSLKRGMSAGLKAQIKGDLRFLASIQGKNASALHQRVFGAGPIDGDAYLAFLSKRLSGFGYDAYPSSKTAVAYNRHGNSLMWITPNYVKYSIPQVMRVTVFLHEARHSEEEHGNWSHADCPEVYVDAAGNPVRSILTGMPIAGRPACDKTAFGAYGIQAMALKNIEANCANCTEKVKLDAGIYGDDDINTRITDHSARRALKADVAPRAYVSATAVRAKTP